MSRITINSNLPALQVGSRLARNTDVLRRSFERLSSGLRINRASDDAAGLAVASGLAVDSRVFTQGIRNLNDGIGVLNIADGALSELSNVVIRIRELATQSANGSLSSTQRLALDREAQQLSKEFSRIAQTTEFNGLKLLGSDFDELRLQGGYGSSGGIESSLGGAIGDQTLSISFDPSMTETGIAEDYLIFDINNDGFNDVVGVDQVTSEVFTRLGDGAGGFTTGASFAISGAATFLDKGDFNGDGIYDLAVLDEGDDEVEILLGDGQGGFIANGSVSTGPGLSDVLVGDLDGDGSDDLVLHNGNDIFSALSNGNGTFEAVKQSPNIVGSAQISLFDLDGDGRDQLIVRRNGIFVDMALNSDGALEKSNTSNFGAHVGNGYDAADFNNDGLLDLVFADSGAGGVFSIIYGQEGGGFGDLETLDFGFGQGILRVADFDGDGILDIAGADEGADLYTFAYGRQDGTYSDPVLVDPSGTTSQLEIGDFNNDGVLDALGHETGSLFSIITSNTTSGTAAILPVSLRNIAESRAAMSVLDRKLEDITEQRGAIGAFISRVDTGISNLGVASSSYKAAESRITDVDVASEAANLARAQILQQASASILSQANQLPALALRLLGS
ncbi:MAG: VCBS repeat-containing protein [Bdellovibrionales bacterium]|nr:VCBS repeat-containing protein [Bdellovibrionales bacterium]